MSMGRKKLLFQAVLFVGVLLLAQVMPTVGAIAGICFGAYLGIIITEKSYEWAESEVDQ